MLQINGKTFMNLQEAVQWLLDNNALPFQSSANYVANTEIGLGTIVNPSPAKVRIGSLIFFADSKVSTVTGLTENGFIVSDQYNDLVDDVVYVSNVAIDASGHLIVTLSNGDDIDAGLIKQITSFSIDASFHLLANYNDGTSTDLGAIFSGNITITGNLSVTGSVEGSEVLEVMNYTGYSATKADPTAPVLYDYVSICKTGNKITFVVAGRLKSASQMNAGDTIYLVVFGIPNDIGSKLYPILEGEILLDIRTCSIASSFSNVTTGKCYMAKNSNTNIYCGIVPDSNLLANTDYAFRYEVTFLLSPNLMA